MAALPFPPPPQRTPLLGADGTMSIPWINWFALVSAVLQSGVSGTFTSADSKTITVVNGLVTKVVS